MTTEARMIRIRATQYELLRIRHLLNIRGTGERYHYRKSRALLLNRLAWDRSRF